MACTVYCLVTEGGQRDRVMHRLEEAGIDPDHIVMIRHPRLHRVSGLSGAGLSSGLSDPPALRSATTPDGPTFADILWWPLVLYTSTSAWLAPTADRSGPTVIPMNRNRGRNRQVY